MTKTRRRAQSPTGGETLLSLLVLGLLAAVTIPNDAPPQRDAEVHVVAMTSSLAVIRNAVDALAADHPSDDTTLSADARALLSRGKLALEPYLRSGRVPLNPVNLRRDVRVVETMPEAPSPAPAGWLLCSSTGEVRANVAGHAPDGTPLFDL